MDTIRTVTINNEPWLVGKDVAEILGYSNPRKAIIDHVDEEDKTDGVTIRDAIGRNQNPVCINESDSRRRFVPPYLQQQTTGRKMAMTSILLFCLLCIEFLKLCLLAGIYQKGEKSNVCKDN